MSPEHHVAENRSHWAYIPPSCTKEHRHSLPKWVCLGCLDPDPQEMQSDHIVDANVPLDERMGQSENNDLPYLEESKEIHAGGCPQHEALWCSRPAENNARTAASKPLRSNRAVALTTSRLGGVG